MSEDKKICPFSFSGYEGQSFNVCCQEEKCMAWGVVGDANEFKWTCKLIEKPNDET